MDKNYPFDLYHGHAPHVDTNTSRAAARSIEPKVGDIAQKVLTFVKACGPDGATCDEVEDALELRHQTASARVRELVQLGKLFDSGRERKTRSGRRATVWVAKRPA